MVRHRSDSRHDGDRGRRSASSRPGCPSTARSTSCDNELDFAGWRVHAGRFVVKNLATATLPGTAVLRAGRPPAALGPRAVAVVDGRAVRGAHDRPVRAAVPPPAVQARPPPPGGGRHRTPGRRRPARAAGLADRAGRRPGRGRLRRIDDRGPRPARRRRRRPPVRPHRRRGRGQRHALPPGRPRAGSLAGRRQHR